jgi:S1-C subfamily serine protease
MQADHFMSDLRSLMTSAQIEEGQRLSREFRARIGGQASNRTNGDDSNVHNNLPRFTGTGFFVTEDGYLLTAFHVVSDAARITVVTKTETFTATLVKADKANDVALLKIAGKSSALPLSSSRTVKLGGEVFTIGFPNIELQGFAPKLTKGEISSLSGAQDDPREFQISVAVQPGNSGGPLVDQYGNVVGIVEARLGDVSTLESTGSLPQNVNYAVKGSLLNLMLESLPEVSAKLHEPNPIRDRKFEDVEQDTESAVVLVMVY